MPVSKLAVRPEPMRELILSIPDDARPGYLRIAEGLRSAIQKGTVKPGERLPSTRVLAESLGVHRHKIGRASWSGTV